MRQPAPTPDPGSDRPTRIKFTHPSAPHRCADWLGETLQLYPGSRELACICIGTDRSTGDSLGPLVGTQLEEMAAPFLRVYGTLDEPVHAVNLENTLIRLKKEMRNPRVIAVDACLGQLSSVGWIQVGNGPVRPGAGVNKQLPEVGQVHVTGIVNVAGFMEYFVLQNTRLSMVMKMANVIASAIHSVAETENSRRKSL
ncbi:spore protease YyaC [Kroppenstedtia eburnea]|uniref:Putative sporulation protein YyaC n=1 Tax=Kroppenstedtia eburnea TaxID=714067 RepID=A0A1N7JHS5_9BACL|nr:spore protease YyaC [Kroppenstedtia eburnea]EGK10376.1 sporulation protein YyaC [Desmospora sp. 8437]QKI83596.1 spore protease YyaC [Kroppenstedtia eburnea]SIS48879.1 putative sporulation protein YyaC [Kroppenstedtia eburnea]